MNEDRGRPEEHEDAVEEALREYAQRLANGNEPDPE